MNDFNGKEITVGSWGLLISPLYENDRFLIKVIEIKAGSKHMLKAIIFPGSREIELYNSTIKLIDDNEVIEWKLTH